jgi:hypothetical protein
MINRNPAELKGKYFPVKLTLNSQGRPELAITYHGVIRAAMISNALSVAL